MKRQQSELIEPGDEQGHYISLAILALIVGALAGLFGALFRYSLIHAGILRNAVIARAHDNGIAGFVLVVVSCAILVGIAGGLVRRIGPRVSGSGIPDVEAALEARVLPPPFCS